MDKVLKFRGEKGRIEFEEKAAAWAVSCFLIPGRVPLWTDFGLSHYRTN
jgi:hypothetical protein